MALLKQIGDWYYLYYRDDGGKEKSKALKTKRKREAEREQKLFEAKQIEVGRLAPIHKTRSVSPFGLCL